MSSTRYYRGSGLLVRSDISLPEYTEAAPGTPDVVIAVGTAATQAIARAAPQTWEFGGFQIAPEGPVFTVDGVGDFLVTGGARIDVSPHAGHDPAMLRLYLMGSGVGMLFHQRGQMVLHGAAVVHSRGVTLFTGPSGAGKSTLAAHLGARGHAILADDTLPLEQTGDGRFAAWPGSRVFKLWQDTLEQLPTPTDCTPIGQRSTKFFVRNAGAAPEKALPLDEIILLDRADGPPRLTPIAGLEAVALISSNTYRPEFLRLIEGGEADHIAQAAALSASVRTLRLSRPWDPARISETLDMLDAHWQGRPARPAAGSK